MGITKSRPRWQTVILVILFTGVLTGIVYVFRTNLLIQGIIFAILGAGVSLTALWEETRRGKFSRLFLGTMILSIFLATGAEVHVALIPAVVFWVLALYYGASDMMNEDSFGVQDDQTENQ